MCKLTPKSYFKKPADDNDSSAEEKAEKKKAGSKKAFAAFEKNEDKGTA